MKNILLFLFLIFISFNSFSQIEKGKMLIGGQLSSTSTKGKGITSFTPKFGYMVDDKFMLGIQIDANSGTNNFTPFARYYAPIKEKVYGFGTLGYTFADTNFLQLGVGLNSFVSDNVAIETGITYLHSNQTNNENTIKTNTLAIGVGIQFFF